jgi:AraC family transcriptional regulator
MQPLDRVLLDTPHVKVGAFRCAVGDPRFRDSGPTENHLVAFPRNGVWIRQAGSRRIVADPRVVTIYNRGQEYERAPICPDGDRSDWFAVAPEHAFAIVREHDPRASVNECSFFRFVATATDAALYLQQRRLFQRLERGEMERFEAEEAVLALVGAVIASAAVTAGRSDKMSRKQTSARRALVDAAQAELARTVSHATDVTELAQRLDTSPYHLCRVFREGTGLTLHAYRLDLRMRTAMERLADARADISRIALELGFSSHSHFTSAFRARVGMTPRDCQVRLLH